MPFAIKFLKLLSSLHYIESCTFTARHHQTNHHHQQQQQDETPGGEEKIAEDTKLNFYKQALDTLHFYIFHIFECGLRSTKQGLQNKYNLEFKNEDNDEYFDREFALLRQSLSKTNTNTKSFERFKRENNSKFTIQTAGTMKSTTTNNVFSVDDDQKINT